MRLSYTRLTALNAFAVLIARQANSADYGAASDLRDNTLIPTGPLPQNQRLCTSAIYCPGPLLQAVQLAQIYEDSKTFVDKPTKRPEADVIAAFARLGDGRGGNVTVAQLQKFLDENFDQEGTELVQADLGSEFNASPTFMANISDAVLHDWISQVHGYWPLLARTTNETSPKGVQCEGCVSSFVPFKERRIFVVPGGRFRELYVSDQTS